MVQETFLWDFGPCLHDSITQLLRICCRHITATWRCSIELVWLWRPFVCSELTVTEMVWTLWHGTLMLQQQKISSSHIISSVLSWQQVWSCAIKQRWLCGENPSRWVLTEIFRPAYLAKRTMLHSKSLKPSLTPASLAKSIEKFLHTSHIDFTHRLVKLAKVWVIFPTCNTNIL